MVDDSLSFWTEIKRYEDELNADPSSMCFLKLAELYRRLGLLDDAVSVSRKGAALHPDSMEALLVLGEACHDRGETEEARKVLEKVLEIEPENVAALKLLGRIFAAEAEFDKAQQLLEYALLQAPGDPEISFLLSSLDAAPPKKPVAVPEPVEPEAAIAFEDLDTVEELIELEEVEVVEDLEEMEELEGLFDLGQLEEKGAPLEAASLHAAGGAKAVPPVAPAETEASEAAEPPSPAAPVRNPLSTATMAELYVAQGFLDKALEVYRELLAADPGNPKFLSRTAELIETNAREAAAGTAGSPTSASEAAFSEPASIPSTTPRAETAAAAGARTNEIVDQLSQWLENIRSRRHGI